MTKCKAPHVGFFSSHQGTGLCPASEPQNVSPMEFWNGSIQQEVRTAMANNQEHDLCRNCYHAERKGDASFRNIYNSQHKHLSQKDLPQWLDLDWSNFCNLKCVMCGPSRSSTWAKETGDYTETNHVRLASQRRIDEVYQLSSTNLRSLNLEGGEPSMMKEYDDYLQYLIDIGASKNCKVSIVTNLTNINKQFYKRLEDFKEIGLCVSIDAHGTANEFTRYPSKFKIIDRNLRWVAETPFGASITIAFQVTTLFNIDKFLHWLYDIQQYFEQHGKKLQIRTQLVNYPTQLHVRHAPFKLKQRCIQQIKQYQQSEKRLRSALLFEVRLLHILKQLQLPHETSQPFVDYVTKIANTRNLVLEDYLYDWSNLQD